MATLNLLFKDYYDVNDKIKIVIPTVGDIVDNEDLYYGQVNSLTAMPIDMMVQLDDAGIDYTQINEFDLFLMLFRGLQSQDTRLIFGDLDLKKFVPAHKEGTDMIVLIDPENDICIDRLVLNKIATVLRKIHHLERNNKKPANEEAKKYLLERARIKMRRNKNKVQDSQLESLIVALVNAEQFKYDFEGTKNLTIYQFNESLQQVVHKVDYEHRMQGVYAGTINPKDLSQSDLTWLSHK